MPVNQLNRGTLTITNSTVSGNSSTINPLGTKQYSYMWKTDKAWKGTCRMLVVQSVDGSRHFAKFRFK